MNRGRILLIDPTHTLLRDALIAHGFEYEEFTGKSLEELKALGDKYIGFVLRSRFHITEDVMDQFPSLRFIARSGSGMEGIDIVAARKRGIDCINSPEGNRNAVAEHAVGMLLALLNRIVKADAEMRRGVWKREENRGRELKGMTLALIGYGNTGMAFAQSLKGFGVDVLAYDKYKTGYSDAWVQEASMDEIFSRADVVSLHVPLTDETNHLVNRSVLLSFQKSIYLINTSRGQVVDTDDLVEALRSGKVSGACLDVHEYERPSFESLDTSTTPSFDYLLKSDKVILTPHIAGWTIESEQRLAEVLAEKIIARFGD